MRTLTALGSLSGSPAVPPKDHVIIGAVDPSGLSQGAAPSPVPLGTDSERCSTPPPADESFPYASRSVTSGSNGCCFSAQTPARGYRDQGGMTP